MPKCSECGSWNLEQTHSFTCPLGGDDVKWYRCLDCGNPEIETINDITTDLEPLIV